MNEIDYRNIDWHLLRTFLTILEEDSVTKAAERLELTQSAVSHALNKLRKIFGDPLFVRSGQGISPTEHARALREPVQVILDSMKSLSDAREFDPRAEPLDFTIAANDLTRDLIFPHIRNIAREQGVDICLTFMPSGVPTATILREARCNLIVTPLPPDGPDMIQLKLFEGKMSCFFDPEVRGPPKNWDEFRQDNHIEVRFGDGRNSLTVLEGIDRNEIRAPRVSVSNFGGLASFVKGSDLLATEVDLMALGPLKELSNAPLPFESRPISIYMVWHRRDSGDPAHKWLRDRIRQVSRSMVK